MNDCISTWVKSHWLIYAFITASIWGIIALFAYTPWKDLLSKINSWYGKIRIICIPALQFLLNFFAGFAGWYFLRIYYGRVKNDSFGWIEVILLLIALFGISGRLGAILWSIPEVLNEIAKEKIRKGLGQQ